MCWKDRYYYFVNFDGEKQNQQVHQLKSIFSVKIRLGKFEKVYAMVGVSNRNKKELEEMLEKFKNTSSTTYKDVEWTYW